MSDAPGKSPRPGNAVLSIWSAAIGAAFVVAGFKVSWLNWIVDVPGSLVSHIVPIDFHEGEGALGFFLAIAVSWLCSSFATWGLALVVAGRFAARGRD